MSDAQHLILELPPLPNDAVVALYETLQELLLAFEQAYYHPIREHYRMTAAPPPQRDLFQTDEQAFDPF